MAGVRQRGRRAQGGTRRRGQGGGLGEARDDWDDDGGLGDAGDEDGAGSGRPQRGPEGLAAMRTRSSLAASSEERTRRSIDLNENF